MKWLIIMDIFSLDDWLLQDRESTIMPAVTNPLNYLGSHPDHQFTAICVHPEGPAVKTFPNGSTIHILKNPIKSLYVRKAIAQQILFKRGCQIAEKEDFDIVYGLSIYALVARRIGKKMRIPSVGRLFGSLVYDVLRKKQYIKLYTRHILQYLEIKYPCDLTISTEDGTELDRAFEALHPSYDSLHLLYNGVNATLRGQLLALDLPQLEARQPIRLLSMARLTYWKRHDLVIRLVHDLRKEHDLPVELSIVGKGETKAKLQQQVATLGAGNYVSFKPPVPRSQLPSLIGAHQASVLLYDASNMGNVMWESCLAGRLIITRGTGKTLQVFGSEHAVIWHDQQWPDFVAEVAQTLQSGKVDHCAAVRHHIDHLLPSWPERMEQEIGLIRAALFR